MNIIQSYWRQLSQRFIIKTAIPHLLLGAIAAGVSLSGQEVLPQPTHQVISIIAIASAMTGLQRIKKSIKHQCNFALWVQKYHRYTQTVVMMVTCFIKQDLSLNSAHGIRAGPLFSA